MSGISTHILDTAAGRHVPGIAVALAARDAAGTWQPVAQSATNSDGRVPQLLPAGYELRAGTYRLEFDIAGRGGFYPQITIVFTVADPSEHYHVPLLLSRYGYTTYRGS